jgi:hypothetical protein
VPPRQDLSQYSKHMARFYAQVVEDEGADKCGTLEGAIENDFQILAGEGCFLTNEEFDKREKAGTLPDDIL